MNTTSLLTGERKGFKREQVSPLKEPHSVNQNMLKLSKVVGASSAVPGFFPPTTIWGDKLVDGGVSDNQGLDALISLDCLLDDDKNDAPDCDCDCDCDCDKNNTPDGENKKNVDSDCDCDKKDAPDGDCDKNDTSDGENKKNAESDCDKADIRDCDDFDILLVSDASGQMEPIHRQSNRALKVLFRVTSILQFQLRRKILRLLRFWERSSGSSREFAFVHLFLNLKGKKNKSRVPSEYIPALGRIRTDLDQFSFIEREVLMYHGYTLIDAQIRRYCKKLKACICKKTCCGSKLAKPPLFRADCSGQDDEQCVSETRLRKRVKDVLEAGSSRFFLYRSWRKYRCKSWLIFVPALKSLFGGWWAIRDYLESLYALTLQIEGWLSSVIPDWVRWVLEKIIGSNSFPIDTQVLTALFWILLWVYVVWFPTYVVMRRAVKCWDSKDYKSLTCQKPTVHWTTNDDSSKG